MELDPLTHDLWITPLMGAAHLYPKGSPTARCGFPWQSQVFDAELERPKNHCNVCASDVNESQQKGS